MGSLRSELEIERERSMKLNQEVQQLQARFSMERQRVTKVSQPGPPPSTSARMHLFTWRRVTFSSLFIETLMCSQVVEEKGARSTELEERVSELSALLDQWKSWGQKRHEEARKLKASVLSLKVRNSDTYT